MKNIQYFSRISKTKNIQGDPFEITKLIRFPEKQNSDNNVDTTISSAVFIKIDQAVSEIIEAFHT